MRLRIALTIMAVILYVGLFNLYIYDLTCIDIKTSKLFYNYLTLSAVSFFVADLKSGFVNSYHKQFNLLLILCIIVNYILIICTHEQWIKNQNVEIMFWSFDVSVFVITVTIFYYSFKYKTFDD